MRYKDPGYNRKKVGCEWQIDMLGHPVQCDHGPNGLLREILGLGNEIT